jgi:hypothetical protein
MTLFTLPAITALHSRNLLANYRADFAPIPLARA